MTEPNGFKGTIKLDLRDSKPDWNSFLYKKAPQDAPNVLVILYDDTGCAAWSTYGGRINMPTLDRLAANGLTYTQWRTTAVCSPTRSCFLTGRNHHANGFGSISEMAVGFPGYCGHIPPENGTIAQVLRDAGWSTLWIGKNHNLPVDAFSIGATKKRWPLGLGYDRFYGFIGGETNQWYPTLIEDNHFIDQPYSPEDGYHLSKDLADKAIAYIRDSKQSEPDKPWYLWYCPGANHAPHHAPQDYIDKYKGKFDDGYEAYREWVLARMIERGIVPKDTELTPINPLPDGVLPEADSVRPWASLSNDEKKLFARMAEVYAAFSEYIDVQIGRVVDYLEESGQLDNTVIFYCADNGASGEGSPSGSVNENRFFNGYPDDIESNMALIDKLGSPDTYNHYPTGWAVAFSTPYKMFKRYSSFAGGTCDPLVIHWPKGIKAQGELRHQYHHCTDIMPTILECCGIEMPKVIDGMEQSPLAGVSMRYSFADAKAPTRKETQYYEMVGTRGIWHKGWKAATLHAPVPSNQGNFDKDVWQLFNVEEDRAEANDLTAQHPDKVKELQDLWMAEAEKNNVLPLIDRVNVYPLSEFDGTMKVRDWSTVPDYPAPPPSPGGGKTPKVHPKTFFDDLPKLFEDAPPLPGEEVRYAEALCLFDAAAKDSKLKAAIVDEATRAQEELVEPLLQFRNSGIPLPFNWTTAINGAAFGTDYFTRTAVARSNIFVNKPNEAKYFYQDLDSSGERLNGANRYKVTFRKGEPPVKGFWSLTLYDEQHFFAPNELNRYSLGTKNRDLKRNADGSVTIYVQADAPAERTNWLPAPKGADFTLFIRAYWPEQSALDGTWTAPPVDESA